MGRLRGLDPAVVEDVWVGDQGEVVVAARPKATERDRCGICRRRSPGYDPGEGRRRWRARDLGTTRAHVEADAPQVRCRRHRVTVCAVPWARHDARFTRELEDQVAWHEISHRKGQRYLTVVVDHDSGRLVLAAPGREKTTVERFLTVLGAKRCSELELVACDMAAWISGPVAVRCPQAERCVDPFHVIQLATRCARRDPPRGLRTRPAEQARARLPRTSRAPASRSGRTPENLTDRQQAKLRRDPADQRAALPRLLKEQLRQIYRLPAPEAFRLLDGWLAWARRSRLRPFVKLARTITDQQAGIVAAIRHGLSNARDEAINTQIRLIARRAFGFHSPRALIALTMLSLGGLCPPLPGR